MSDLDPYRWRAIPPAKPRHSIAKAAFILVSVAGLILVLALVATTVAFGGLS